MLGVTVATFGLSTVALLVIAIFALLASLGGWRSDWESDAECTSQQHTADVSALLVIVIGGVVALAVIYAFFNATLGRHGDALSGRLKLAFAVCAFPDSRRIGRGLPCGRTTRSATQPGNLPGRWRDSPHAVGLDAAPISAGVSIRSEGLSFTA